MMLEVLIGVLVMEVDKVADEVTNMEVDKVTNMTAEFATNISYKFVHQVAPLVLVENLSLSSSMSITPIFISIYYGITIRQSYISKVLSRYLHSPGSHQ